MLLRRCGITSAQEWLQSQDDFGQNQLADLECCAFVLPKKTFLQSVVVAQATTLVSSTDIHCIFDLKPFGSLDHYSPMKLFCNHSIFLRRFI
jgi:hypothetical protein